MIGLTVSYTVTCLFGGLCVFPANRSSVGASSITLNDREARFSQPKLELYGLYRALRSLKLYLIGIRNIIIEVDAKYIKGMLSNPDISPSASMNWWILSNLMFHFMLVHVPGTHHGPDGLSCQRSQPGDEEELEDNFDDWINQVNGFIHFINDNPAHRMAISTLPPVMCFVTTIKQGNSAEPTRKVNDDDDKQTSYWNRMTKACETFRKHRNNRQPPCFLFLVFLLPFRLFALAPLISYHLAGFSPTHDFALPPTPVFDRSP